MEGIKIVSPEVSPREELVSEMDSCQAALEQAINDGSDERVVDDLRTAFFLAKQKLEDFDKN